MLENSEEVLKYQRIWESLILPKGYCLESQLFQGPVVFFIITGGVKIEINHVEEHTVFSQEMFMAQNDIFYGITMMEQTHILICYVPVETWFIEQKWIDELVAEGADVSEEFFKLPIKRVIARYLSLLNLYLKEGIYSSYFFEIKRQELFFLLFFCYRKHDLVRFLQCILSRDMQFKKFVMDNFSNARNVRELAKYANYSTSGFIKKFQRCFNESPYKWMQKQRAKQISVEINRGIKSLQEIADEYKFSSYQHFSVFCKAQLGLSPTEILSRGRLKRLEQVER